MQVFLYAYSDLNIGYDSVRRLSIISKLLQKQYCENTLLTNNLKVGLYAKNRLGINKYHHLNNKNELKKYIKKGDILIYEAHEENDFIENEILHLCTLSYKIPDDIPFSVIDRLEFNRQNKRKIEKLFFYGDDDKNEVLLKEFEKYICKIPFLLGYDFTQINRQKLKSIFSNIINENNYASCIKNSNYLLSGSLYTCIESIFSGGKPVLLKRKDKTYDEKFIKSINLPTIVESTLEADILKFEYIISNYPKVQILENFDITQIIRNIFIRIETYRKLTV